MHCNISNEYFKQMQRLFIMGSVMFSGVRIHEGARDYDCFFMQNTSLIDVDLSSPGRFSVALSSPRGGETRRKGEDNDCFLYKKP